MSAKMSAADGASGATAASSVPSHCRKAFARRTRTPRSRTAYSRSPSTRRRKANHEGGVSRSSEAGGGRRAAGGPARRAPARASAQMLVDQRGHLEHRDLLLAAEDLFQIVIGVDHPLVLLVLQAVGFDVVPHLLGNLAPRYRFAANDRRQVCTGLHLG